MEILNWLKNKYRNDTVIYYIYNQKLCLYLMQNFCGLTNLKAEAGKFNEVSALDFIHLCHREGNNDFILIERRGEET